MSQCDACYETIETIDVPKVDEHGEMTSAIMFTFSKHCERLCNDCFKEAVATMGVGISSIERQLSKFTEPNEFTSGIPLREIAKRIWLTMHKDMQEFANFDS